MSTISNDGLTPFYEMMSVTVLMMVLTGRLKLWKLICADVRESWMEEKTKVLPHFSL